jgi:hypothetical protein
MLSTHLINIFFHSFVFQDLLHTKKVSRWSVFFFNDYVVGLYVLFEATILLGLYIKRTNDLKSIQELYHPPATNFRFARMPAAEVQC